MEKQTGPKTINNDFYEELGDGWYTAFDHPIALLRAENAVRVPWILGKLGPKPQRVLDIGCGAGLLTNALAAAGHETSGVDLSESSLAAARQRDPSKKVVYLKGNAYCLPFPNASFDACCATDVLEHVEDPGLLIAEASRVLKPGGLFFFHTFNRNPLSYLLIIKGVDWFVKNAPKNMHVYPLFIKPSELEELLQSYRLEPIEWIGLRPAICNRPFFQMLFTRKVPADFRFCFSKSLATGYCGIARKAERWQKP